MPKSFVAVFGRGFQSLLVCVQPRLLRGQLRGSFGAVLVSPLAIQVLHREDSRFARRPDESPSKGLRCRLNGHRFLHGCADALLRDAAETRGNGLGVVVRALVALGLLLDVGGCLFDLLAVADLLALLYRKAGLDGATVVLVQFLLEEQQLLFLHVLFGLLGVRVEVKVLSLLAVVDKLPSRGCHCLDRTARHSPARSGLNQR